MKYTAGWLLSFVPCYLVVLLGAKAAIDGACVAVSLKNFGIALAGGVAIVVTTCIGFALMDDSTEEKKARNSRRALEKEGEKP